MTDTNSTLFIRHLPAELTEKEKESLLKHFGAVRVKCMGTLGRLKHTAFAVFESKDEAERALGRLHQLEVLSCRLNVEFSKKHFEQFHPKLSDSETFSEKLNEDKSKKKEITQHQEEDLVERQVPQFGKIAEKLGIDYPYNPNLHYIYPSPDVNILTNIAHALATVPKFYVQVLHLMNKMNMPAPFGPVTPAPPLPEGRPAPADYRPSEPSWPEEEEMDIQSTDESEIQSDTEDAVREKKQETLKRTKQQKKRPRKKLKLHDLIIPKPVPSGAASNAPKAEDVFEQPQATAQKKIEIKVSAAADPGEGPANLQPEQSLDKVSPMPVEEGGFGKIEPVLKEEGDEVAVESDSDVTEFITSSELKRGRLSSKEMKQMSVFKKYDAGEQTSRLYIKNLTKLVTEKDLKYIYGRYIDWTSEEETNMFDIRHMTEGRMKGQAFVTLPSEKHAQKALDETNGYVLNGKAMVVQFARSAKPKEKEDPKSKEKKQ